MINVTCCICNRNETKEVKINNKYMLVRCKFCGLIYVNPQHGLEELKKIYSDDYFLSRNSDELGYDDYFSDSENIMKTAMRRLKVIEKIISPGRLLDVGCAYGFFLEAAKRRGWQAWGVELAKTPAAYARDILGFKVLCQDIESVNLGGEKFDAVTLWDVIEHLADPRKVVEKLRSLIDDHGLLILTTPDIESLPARITRNRWIGFKSPDEHLWYFSRCTIIKLLESAGFKVEKTFYAGKYIKLGMYMSRLSKYIPLVKGWTFLLNKGKSSYYANPFDIICVAARKC